MKKSGHLLYWTLAFFNVLFAGLYQLDPSHGELDIAFHDTYFVVDYFQIFLFFSLWVFFLGGQLWLIERQRRKFPKWLMLSNAVISSLPPWVLFVLSNRGTTPVKRYYDYSVYHDMSTSAWSMVDFLTFFLVGYLLLQIVFTLVFVARLLK